MPAKRSDEEARAFFISKGLTPLEPYPGQNKPWKSKCKNCKQIVSPHFSSIKAGRRCGVCSGAVVLPEMAIKVMRKANLDPLLPYPGTKTAWKCKCMKCGHIVHAYYSDVLHRGAKCGYCQNKVVDVKEAVRVMNAAGFIPQVPYPGSSEGWHCKCKVCKHDLYPAYTSVKWGNTGCKYCKKLLVIPSEAVAVMRKRNLEPLVAYPGAKSAWKCRCTKCRRIVSPQYSAIARGGQDGCKYCSRKAVDPITAKKFMVSKGLIPLEPYSRSDGPWKCRCKRCKNVVTPKYIAGFRGQGGCKFCATSGIDYQAPAFIYLMTHRKYGAHKIGIGTDKTVDNRIRAHERAGWESYRSVPVFSAIKAEEIEFAVLTWIRKDLGLPPYLSKKEMARGGYTETIEAAEIELPTIWRQILLEKHRLG